MKNLTIKVKYDVGDIAKLDNIRIHASLLKTLYGFNVVSINEDYDAVGDTYEELQPRHFVQLTAESRIGFVGWKDFTHKWNALAKEIWADKDAAAAFRARLVKDSAPAGEIILNTFIIKSLKDQSNGKQDSSQN